MAKAVTQRQEGAYVRKPPESLNDTLHASPDGLPQHQSLPNEGARTTAVEKSSEARAHAHKSARRGQSVNGRSPQVREKPQKRRQRVSERKYPRAGG